MRRHTQFLPGSVSRKVHRVRSGKLNRHATPQEVEGSTRVQGEGVGRAGVSQRSGHKEARGSQGAGPGASSGEESCQPGVACTGGEEKKRLLYRRGVLRDGEMCRRSYGSGSIERQKRRGVHTKVSGWRLRSPGNEGGTFF